MKSEKIVARTRKLKRQEKPATAVDPSEQSVFTDADFEVVSRLHFVNSKKAVLLDDES